MTRTHILTLLALLGVAVPAAAFGVVYATASADKPCIVSGNAGYALSVGAAADITVRIDNAAAEPSLRLQRVDDPAAAEFVLVDDGDAFTTCKLLPALRRVRLDPTAQAPDLTVAISRDEAEHKIFVRSSSFSETDAAALFAAMWRDAGLAARRKLAARQ